MATGSAGAEQGWGGLGLHHAERWADDPAREVSETRPGGRSRKSRSAPIGSRTHRCVRGAPAGPTSSGSVAAVGRRTGPRTARTARSPAIRTASTASTTRPSARRGARPRGRRGRPAGPRRRSGRCRRARSRPSPTRPSSSRPADDEVAEPDALDAAADRRLEPVAGGRRLGCRRRSRRRRAPRPVRAGACRGRARAGRSPRAARRRRRAGRGTPVSSRVAGSRRRPPPDPARRRLPDRRAPRMPSRRSSRRRRIADLALLAEGDDEQIAGELPPQPDDDRAARRRSAAGTDVLPAPGSSASSASSAGLVVAAGRDRRRRVARPVASRAGPFGLGRARASRGSTARPGLRRLGVVSGCRPVERAARVGRRGPSRSRTAARRGAGPAGQQVEQRSGRSRRAPRPRRARGRACGPAPGRPAAIRASRAASGGSASRRRRGSPRSRGSATGPSRIRAAARADRRQEAVLVVGAEDDRDAGGRLLERLEERGLGVVGQAVGPLDDRDARRRPRRAAARGRERGDGPSRPPGRSRVPIRIWSPGTRRREAMDVRVAAALDEPAAAAGAARPCARGPGRRTAGRPRDRGRASSCRSRPVR